MAPNSEPVCAEISQYLSQRLDRPVEFIAGIPWQERERRLDAGEIDVCWICGLPYVNKADKTHPVVELLAAPVFQGDRYHGQPVYYSDVIVRFDRPYQRFADLRGAVWAYNEPGSQSGYNITRFTLARLGETAGFFGGVVASGAHQVSLQMVLSGRIDATAIDSTVLELELARDPSIAAQIRTIDRLGPSPAPPWLVASSLPPELKGAIRGAFLGMHADPEGSRILSAGRMERFVSVEDRDYDPIREMDRLAGQVTLLAF